MKPKGLLPLNIQMFANPEPNELEDLVNELKDKPANPDPTKTVTTDPAKAPEVDPTKTTEVDPNKPKETDPTKVPEVDPNKKTEVDPNKKTEEKPKEEENAGIKALRKAHDDEKKKAKELEDANKTAKEVTERLIKAVKLGIKGETQEEILANLEAHEIKELAGQTGLTEDQVRKDAELKAEMQKLSAEKQEVLFNRRAYDLQRAKNITNEQVVEFVKTAADLGIDLLTNPTPFDKLYEKVMGGTNSDVIAQKDALIASLEKQVQALKAGKAPEEGSPGSDGDKTPSNWEEQIAKMPGVTKK